MLSGHCYEHGYKVNRAMNHDLFSNYFLHISEYLIYNSKVSSNFSNTNIVTQSKREYNISSKKSITITPDIDTQKFTNCKIVFKPKIGNEYTSKENKPSHDVSLLFTNNNVPTTSITPSSPTNTLTLQFMDFTASGNISTFLVSANDPTFLVSTY